jgi:hypothetical protein
MVFGENRRDVTIEESRPGSKLPDDRPDIALYYCVLRSQVQDGCRRKHSMLRLTCIYYYVSSTTLSAARGHS